MTIFFIALIVVLVFGFVVFFGAPYVPSKLRDLRKAFDELYHITPQDLLLDLGSGDGVVLREAARRGARAIGYELNPVLVVIANFFSRHDDRVSSRTANFFTRPFPDTTTLVYVFGDNRDIHRIMKRIEDEATRLNRTLSVISYGFQLPDRTPSKKTATHFLYEISPLHPGQPQV